MKNLFSILILSLLMFTTSVVAQKDTLTVVQNPLTKVVQIKSQKSGNYNINPFEYTGQGNVIAVYVAGTMPDTNRIEIRSANTGTVLKRYLQTTSHLRTYGITAIGASYINAFIQPPNLAQRNYTSAQRDSINAWGFAPLGTIIYNTTIDSPQIKTTNTVTPFRSF